MSESASSNSAETEIIFATLAEQIEPSPTQTAALPDLAGQASKSNNRKVKVRNWGLGRRTAQAAKSQERQPDRRRHFSSGTTAACDQHSH